MKKLILFTLLVSSLFAESSVYIGTGYENYTETLKSTNNSISENAGIFKVGYGDRKAYSIEFSLEYIDITDPSLDFNSKYGFNISLLKAFDFDIYVLPYVKVGFGAGKRDTSSNPAAKTLSYGSFNLGTGIFLPLSQDWDIETAYEYRHLSYANSGGTNINNSNYEKSNVHIVYLGLNYRF